MSQKLWADSPIHDQIREAGLDTAEGSLNAPTCSLPCFECGKPSDHNHHVIPRVYGGTKTVPLCEECHGKVHDRKFTNHRELTQKGLRAAKARGVKLGVNGKRLAEANKEAANTRAQNLAPVLEEIRAKGHKTIKEITAELNRREIPTARGGKWHPTSVQRLLSRQNDEMRDR